MKKERKKKENGSKKVAKTQFQNHYRREGGNFVVCDPCLSNSHIGKTLSRFLRAKIFTPAAADQVIQSKNKQENLQMLTPDSSKTTDLFLKRSNNAPRYVKRRKVLKGNKMMCWGPGIRLAGKNIKRGGKEIVTSRSLVVLDMRKGMNGMQIKRRGSD